MRHTLPVALILLCCRCGIAQQSAPSGDAVIRAPYAGSEVVITTTSRLAGAIHSLTWNGVEFIDSADHGRQLQSASNFDVGTTFSGETFNPTEAGARHDGAGQTSTSRLLHIVAKGNQLQTTSQMAFWLRPGDKSGDNLAKNQSLLSNHLLTKRVTIGYEGMANVVKYDVTFGVPVGERHRYAQFEAVTGYMPPKFDQFLTFDTQTSSTAPFSDGPGEQESPIIFSTSSGSHAMGVYSPQQPSAGFEHAGYGRWNFKRQHVVKWNCVFRIKDKRGIAAGDYKFRSFVVVGSRKSVAATMKRLIGKLNERRQ